MHVIQNPDRADVSFTRWQPASLWGDWQPRLADVPSKVSGIPVIDKIWTASNLVSWAALQVGLAALGLAKAHKGQSISRPVSAS